MRKRSREPTSAVGDLAQPFVQQYIQPVGLAAFNVAAKSALVGRFPFVAAGAVVNRNVKPYALMAGVPAKQIGWISQHGEKLDLPLTGQASAPVTPRDCGTYCKMTS